MVAVKTIAFRIFILFAGAALLTSCSHKQYKEPHVVIETSFGDIELELYPSKAPKTVAAFLSFVDSGYYNNTSFYRVLKTEDLPTNYNPGVIQGGLYKTKDELKAKIAGIPHESTRQSGLTHTNGIVSLARTAAGTGNTEFFICIDDQSQFDYGNSYNGDTEGFAAFGKVFSGMEVVKNIENQSRTGESFDKKIEIRKISRL